VNTYALHGAIFESCLDLPELQPVDGPAQFRLVDQRLAAPGGDWVDPWTRDPRGPWIRIQFDRGYRIRYEGQADFHLSPDRRTLAVDARGCPPATLRHFLLDQVIPLVLSTRQLVLHASAVSVDGHALVFTGPCGSGKSTLAILLARRGFPVLADDAVVVAHRGSELNAVPAYPGVRLWPDAIAGSGAHHDGAPVTETSAKRRVRNAVGFDGRTQSLRSVYVLSARPSSEPAFAPLSPRDTAMAFVEHGFRLEQRDREVLAIELDRACRAARVARAWALRYPREWASADRVVDAVLAHARATSEASCCS
jgi:hypothetical protein